MRTICLIAQELRRRETELILCALSVQVLDKIRVTGFDGFVSIYESRAQALDALEIEA